MKRAAITATCFAWAALTLGGEPATNRPAAWARPIKLDGVPNLNKVSENLYRSAQPTAQGMRSLKASGIATVVNLRSFHSDREELGETGLEGSLEDRPPRIDDERSRR